MTTGSRSSTSPDDELRLPRAPGVFRRFWARHPLFADVLVGVLCLLLSIVPVAAFDPARRGTGGLATAWPATGPMLVVLTIAGCALLLVRRRRPLAPFIVALVLGHAFLLAPVPVGGTLLLFATYSVAVYRSTRAAVIGLLIGLGALSVFAFGLASAGLIAPNIAWNTVVGEVLMGLIGGLIGANVGNRKRYVDAIIARSRQLLVERDQQGQLSAVAERARIARELHDIVSHSLTVIVALAEGAGATADRDRARAATDQVAETARGALAEMRSMLGVLRDEHADPAAPLAPLGDDPVGAAVAAARSAGFPVVVRTTGTAELPVAHTLAVSRIVQEGLTNAMRHAPQATRIEVSLSSTPDAIEVAVVNDGVGAPSSAGGYGLRGIRERVDHVGGVMSAGPGTPGTWVLRARLPLSGSVPPPQPPIEEPT